jgi:hypothetical protein
MEPIKDEEITKLSEKMIAAMGVAPSFLGAGWGVDFAKGIDKAVATFVVQRDPPPDLKFLRKLQYINPDIVGYTVISSIVGSSHDRSGSGRWCVFLCQNYDDSQNNIIFELVDLPVPFVSWTRGHMDETISFDDTIKHLMEIQRYFVFDNWMLYLMDRGEYEKVEGHILERVQECKNG